MVAEAAGADEPNHGTDVLNRQLTIALSANAQERQDHRTLDLEDLSLHVNTRGGFILHTVARNKNLDKLPQVQPALNFDDQKTVLPSKFPTGMANKVRTRTRFTPDDAVYVDLISRLGSEGADEQLPHTDRGRPGDYSRYTPRVRRTRDRPLRCV